MYRDELATYRERLDAARQDAARVWQDVNGQLEGMRARNEQLKQRKLRGVEPPEIDPVRTLEQPGEGATAADYIALCDGALRESRAVRLIE